MWSSSPSSSCPSCRSSLNGGTAGAGPQPQSPRRLKTNSSRHTSSRSELPESNSPRAIPRWPHAPHEANEGWLVPFSRASAKNPAQEEDRPRYEAVYSVRMDRFSENAQDVTFGENVLVQSRSVLYKSPFGSSPPRGVGFCSDVSRSHCKGGNCMVTSTLLFALL